MWGAAQRLREEVGGALSPSAAYEVVMEQYLNDPEGFRCVLFLGCFFLGG